MQSVVYIAQCLLSFLEDVPVLNGKPSERKNFPVSRGCVVRRYYVVDAEFA
jgi:hypothetical protein